MLLNPNYGDGGYGLYSPRRRRSSGPAGPVAPVPTNTDIIFFGDSRQAYGFNPTLNANGYWASMQPIGIAPWIGPRSGHKLRTARFANFGENGNTSAQMIASPRQNGSGTTNASSWFRPNSNAAGNATDLANNNPGQKSLAAAAAHPAGMVCILAPTNDTVGQFDTTSRANILTMIAALASKTIILFNELPRGRAKDGTAGFTVANAVERKNFSDWVKTLDYASGHVNAKANVIVIDSWAAFVDPASGTNYFNIIGTLWDGIHPSVYGARLLADLIVARLSAIWPHWNSLPSKVVKPTAHGLTTPGLQQPYVNTNPLMATVGGNGTVAGTFANAPDPAQIPTGWELVGGPNTAGLTATPSKSGFDPDGRTAFGLSLVGTSPASVIGQTTFRQRFSTQTAVDAEVAAGRLSFTDKLRASGMCFIPTGSQGIYWPSLELFIQEATATKRIKANIVGSQRSMFRDVDGLENGGIWYHFETEMVDLAEPNMTTSPGNVSVVQAIFCQWIIYTGNDTIAATQTVDTNGQMLFSQTGFRRVTE